MTKHDLFSVVYSFKVPEEHAAEFIELWSALTQLIYQYEGSYGSRLHRASPGHFIGYAQWPNKKIWARSGGNLPEESNAIRKQMRELCTEIKTQYELEVVQDLLKDTTFDIGNMG
jgi:quinol monooxygenase YgiN